MMNPEKEKKKVNRVYIKIIGVQACVISTLCGILILLLLGIRRISGMQVGTELYVAVLVAAVTSTISIVGFVVMIVNDIRYHRQDVYRFDSLDKEAGGLNARHDRATTEHDRLSTEHNNLKERLEKIYLNQEKDKAAREAAGKTMPEESKLVDLVSEIYEHHNQLMKRNIELENEVIQLKLQLNQYIQSKKDPTQESSWDLEDISGYGADRDDEEWER